MAEFTRTKAFAALADILALPGTDSLRLVDVSIATPVIDLTRIIRSGVAQLWSFTRIVQHAGAADSSVAISPWDTSGWSNISRGAGAGLTTALGNDMEALILSFGVVSSGTVTESIIYLRQDNLSSAPRPRIVLWWGDQGIGALASNQMIVQSTAGSEYRKAPPLLLGPNRSPWRLRFDLSTSGIADTTLSLRLLAAPPGVLPLP